MAFYDLDKTSRANLVSLIKDELFIGLKKNSLNNALLYFGDEDTYIRKAAYLSIGKLYLEEKDKQPLIVQQLEKLMSHSDFKVRQTLVNAAGEIGKTDFEIVRHFFETALFDEHHSVRNAVIGSVKKMGEKNPLPVLEWSKQYLYHQDKEIRREICHGIELRGRTHPQDILPLLKELQFDKTARVRNTLVHVIGQIAYKKGCLQTVIKELNTWENRALTDAAIEEIIDVHYRYRNFSVLTQQQAIEYIHANYKK